ncbi:MAG: FHA domain-containing serine/threonine-protein kinase [Planctomycetota bacterium]
MRFGLRMLQGAFAGRVLGLAQNQTVIMGRGSDTSVRLPDMSLSRRHCQLTNTPRGLLIADLGSSNGTFLNGNRLPQGWHQVRPGDRVMLGSCEFHVFDYDAQPSTASSGVHPNPVAQSSQDAGQAIPDPDRFPGFRLQRKLGQGAFGEVFQAIETQHNRVVALKVVNAQLVRNPKDIQRFLREAETGQSLNHPNVLKIYSAGESRGAYYIAMEFIPGKEVSELIKTYGRLDVGYVLRLAIQLASGLQHAYEQGIVHRDIKPDNVMVLQHPQHGAVAKLVDFGLAKCFTDDDGGGLTEQGEGMGTLAYMPPEQLDNALNADQRSDIYSLGATIFHMLSGQRPFAEKTTRSFIKKILQSAPPSLCTLNPQVPRELDEIIQRAMSKSPDDRYQTPQELQDDLLALFRRLAAEHASRSGGG